MISWLRKVQRNGNRPPTCPADCPEPVQTGSIPIAIPTRAQPAPSIRDRATASLPLTAARSVVAGQDEGNRSVCCQWHDGFSPNQSWQAGQNEFGHRNHIASHLFQIYHLTTHDTASSATDRQFQLRACFRPLPIFYCFILKCCFPVQEESSLPVIFLAGKWNRRDSPDAVFHAID